MSVQSAQPDATSAVRRTDPAGSNGAGGGRQALLARLRPMLIEDFKNDDVSSLPRPELALRIGQIVTNELNDELDNLNLLERRNLVGELINWLLTSAAPSSASS